MKDIENILSKIVEGFQQVLLQFLSEYAGTLTSSIQFTGRAE